MHLTKFAKTLRTTLTEAENRLWYHIRAHRFLGLKFRRQKPIGNYIVDFVCHECQLILELDGGQHQEMIEEDKRRDEWLQAQGYTVLRFWDNDVLNQTEAVLEKIRSVTRSLSP
ncbi:MAG: endonuclease domain-containing protein, partial [Burkholderiaceae bacterium]|nr:endonuclease domain-containing protein [Burkholderiaceae bacterium]